MASLLFNFIQRLTSFDRGSLQEEDTIICNSSNECDKFNYSRPNTERTRATTIDAVIITLHNKQQQNNKKTVTFNKKIRVILIPTAKEYHEAGCDLWWREEDYYYMREDFRCEVEDIIRQDLSLNNDINLAMHKLYQPESINKPKTGGYGFMNLGQRKSTMKIESNTPSSTGVSGSGQNYDSSSVSATTISFIFSSKATKRRFMSVRTP